ncbi:hypothetical protein [Halococcus sp. IIIV-5B]|uniref:hypothetical protein n=1 Tax=Halococcus sp. IIIV-5B TaxID=2321230 RepID=UPI000E720577|nr:hypothetical protein [Halococcus sp. IIIV-5B]RJT04700.1 hypothetical protein D3261_08790 [Halococcus sp. IIIV-5B]
MSPDQTESNRERVENALRRFMSDDPHGNAYRYLRASDLTDEDGNLSASVVGSYLPKLRDDSPLDGGLVVEEYTECRCGPSLWLARRENE